MSVDEDKANHSHSRDAEEETKMESVRPNIRNSATSQTDPPHRSNEETQITAGHGEFFNTNMMREEISTATHHITSCGIQLFRDGVERTKQLLIQEHHEIGKEIDPNYEIIDQSEAQQIPTDTVHAEGQRLLMESDQRIQSRITALLIFIGLELPVQDWSWFDLVITGLLKCGTIKMINCIDRDLIGKILLGLCWILPPFIGHFFDPDIEHLVSSTVIQIHSNCCLLMVLFAVYDTVTSATHYDWKRALLSSLFLVAFSAVFYVLFYSQNVFNAILCVVAIPYFWRLDSANDGMEMRDRASLKKIYSTHCQSKELYPDEVEFVAQRVFEITEEVLRKKKRRKRWTFGSMMVLWTCFVFKCCGHIQSMMPMYAPFENATAADPGTKEELRGGNGGNECDEGDVLCQWLLEEMKLNEYVDVFRDHGFDSMQLICSLDRSNLDAMGIYKQGHVNVLIQFTSSPRCISYCPKDDIE